MSILLLIIWVIIILWIIIIIYDLFFQKDYAIKANFPWVWRFRYFFHELRPFFRQYFWDDDAFAPRIIVDWIRNVAEWKSWYFWFDKFDTSKMFEDPRNAMIHSNSPYNDDEMKPVYPIIGEKKEYPLQFHTYFYRSAMSLWSLSFEATTAMAKACADAHAVFNTWEWWLSIHHLPNLKFSREKKFLLVKKIPQWTKYIYYILPWIHLKNRFLERCWNYFEPEKWERDLFLFDKKYWLFYTINRDAPLKYFPKPEDLTEKEYGQIILQIWSGLYWLRKKSHDGTHLEIDRERFKKTSSFVRAIEIKLAQWAKQTWWILKAEKNTHTIATIRWVKEWIDLISPNRFPYYDNWKEKEFFSFMDELSEKSWGKPIWCKIVVSDQSNIEAIAKELSKTPIWHGPDFITIDGWDWWSGAAPIALWIMYGKNIYDALEIVNNILEQYKVRDRVKLLASSKLYAPHMSARALACWADAIGNARSIMISWWCIRAWLCSGEHWPCPIGMATMNKNKRRWYEQVMPNKILQIINYIKAHNKWLIQAAAVAWITSPHLFEKKHLAYYNNISWNQKK